MAQDGDGTKYLGGTNMNLTYQELVDGEKLLRYRSREEARTAIKNAPRINRPWTVNRGILIIEGEKNDTVIRFAEREASVSLDVYERVVRKTMDGLRMHDDHCRLLFRGCVRKDRLSVRVTEDPHESSQLERKRTLEEFHRYEHLLEEDEVEEFRSAYDPGQLTEHRKRRTALFKSAFKMIDAMNKFISEDMGVEARSLNHKQRRFSPAPLRPSCELYSIRRSFVRWVERKGLA